MDKYTVIAGQNIFDVSLHLYGSLEGILDLLVSNPGLSFCEDLKAGQVLNYTDGFLMHEDIVNYNRIHEIVPANGEREVYFKSSCYDLWADLYISNQVTHTYFEVSGSGVMEIDWGDNTPLVTVGLSEEHLRIEHSFNSAVPGERRIRVYGDFYIGKLDLSALPLLELFFFRPVSVERLILKGQKLAIDSLALLRDTYELNLQGIKTGSLLPLLESKGLMEVDLRGVSSQKVLDEYVMALVRHHYGRRSCTVRLSSSPSGVFREPERDEHLNDANLTGMEAIWLLIHEPSWNEGGNWKFIINDQVYSDGQD